MAKRFKSGPKHVVGSNAQVNLIDEKFIVMITEITHGWWIDIGTSRNVCYDCAILKTYANVGDKKMFLEDAHTINVAEIYLRKDFDPGGCHARP